MEIREKLKQLRARDRQLRVPGAVGHGYRLNPPLSEAQVRAFESERGISLPLDYRAFLTQVGNGGAGPYYGVDKLGEIEGQSFEECPLIGDLAAPFPYEGAWNLPASFWELQPDWSIPRTPDEEQQALDEWDATLEQHYWAPEIVNGAIPICHLGCALRHWLVVSGGRSGEIWADHRADYEGVWPVADASGRPLTFAAWYTAWLDEALGRLPRRGMAWLRRLVGG